MGGGYAQNLSGGISLTPNNITVASGAIVNYTAVGEAVNRLYGVNTAISLNSNDVGITWQAGAIFGSNSPSKFSYKFTNYSNLPVTGIVRFVFFATSLGVNGAMWVIDVTITVNPAPTFYSNSRDPSFTKNNCPVGYKGSSVRYLVFYGTFISRISQADADQQATDDISANGQNNANTLGTCTLLPTYCSSSRSPMFYKNNCPPGTTGSAVVYLVPHCKYTSTISQADADAKAQTEINANGQNNANNLGTCTQTYFNAALTTNFTRNNCAVGQIGSVVAYTVAANKYTSIISQADANSKAQAETTANGQANANSLGTCTSPFYNTALSINFTKNNCSVGQIGSVVAYVVPANKYSSTISLADANSKAQAEVTANGQTNANSLGFCEPTFRLNAGCTGVTQSGLSLIVSGLSAGQTVEIPDADNFNIQSFLSGVLRASLTIDGGGGTGLLEVLIKQNGIVIFSKNVPYTIPASGRACTF